MDEYWVPREVGAFDAGAGDDPLITGDAGADAGLSMGACPEGTPALFNNAHSPYLGGDDSVALEVIHFSSFHCPYCAQFADYSRALFQRRPDFQRRVRLYFHHFPYSTETTWKQHMASRAAANQGMEHFWAMHDYIYDGLRNSSEERPSSEDLVAFARDELKLDMARFNADMDSDQTISYLKWDIDQGRSVSIVGTPTIIVCGQFVDRLHLEQLIDLYLTGE